MGVCMEYRCLGEARKGVRSPVVGLTGGGEQSNMGAGNLTWVLEEYYEILPTESSLCDLTHRVTTPTLQILFWIFRCNLKTLNRYYSPEE